MAEAQGTESAARVADVLLLFTDGPDRLGVSAVARELNLSKAVVHRILQTLLDRGLVSSDPDTRSYALGPAAAALGARALRESHIRRVALPVLGSLQQATGETTTLSARVPDGRVYLEQVESRLEIKMTVEVGRRFPLHAGSSGMAILAFLPPAEREELLAGTLRALTTRTVVDAGELRRHIDRTRRLGYATSDGQRQEGASSVAAPVFGVDGTVLGSVSVCGPAHRIGTEARESIAPLLREAADRVSRGMGWRGGLPTESGQDRR
ncbi:IclR family transcriptional regulator [Streptomyces sp. NPDC058045]|uniref:IclR family transcriptional regulator n=1 Tax=Streptomyces sp. NPDC058045 TaxID=3346311 RepID=UPI0036E4AD40